MKIGRRLAIKMLNASRFVLGHGVDAAPANQPEAVTDPLDRALLAPLAGVVAEATAAFEDYNYTRALEADRDLLLVVLRRLPGAGQGPGLRRPGPEAAASARAALGDCAVRAAAPVRPVPAVRDRGGLVAGGRRARCTAPPGPTVDEVARIAQDGEPSWSARSPTCSAAIRKAKSEAKVSMRADVAYAAVLRRRRRRPPPRVEQRRRRPRRGRADRGPALGAAEPGRSGRPRGDHGLRGSSSRRWPPVLKPVPCGSDDPAKAPAPRRVRHGSQVYEVVPRPGAALPVDTVGMTILPGRSLPEWARACGSSPRALGTRADRRCPRVRAG